MRTFCILFMCILFLGVSAQNGNSGKDSYLMAEEAYRDGQFEKAIRILEIDMKGYDSALAPNVYRLLALCYMAIDQSNKASEYVYKMLKYVPYYMVTLQDPERFADLVKKCKTGKRTLVTASQQQETLEEAPVPVTLITEEMVKILGARTLKEVLIAYVPGMTSIESNEEMNIAMRSIYSSGQEKILIMLNGHRLNSYSTNTSCPDFSISLEKVKQIEVLRGPASSLYGGVALTAVVNIVTKLGIDINGMRCEIGSGNYGQYYGNFLFGKDCLDWSVMGWAFCYNASGQEVNVPVEEQKNMLPVPGNIIIGGYNQKPSFDIGLNLTVENLRLLYNTKFSKTIAPYSMSYFFAPYSYSKYRTFKGNAPGFSKLSHHLEASLEKQIGNFHMKAGINFDAENQSRYQVGGDTIPDIGYNILYPLGTNDSVSVSQGAFQYHNWQETNWGSLVQGSYQYVLANKDKGTISAGVQWNKFSLGDSYYLEGDHFDRVLVTFDSSKNLYTGTEICTDAYFQIKHQWRQLFIVNLGMRYDYKKRRNNKVIHEYSPRVAFILLQPKWNLKFSYAKSFVDAPYFYRNNTLDTTTGGEDLLSEYLHSWQLTFIGNGLFPGLEFETNFFYNRATDFIVPDGLVYTNAGILENLGLELSSTYQKQRFQGHFNFAWQYVLSYDKYKVNNHSVYNIPPITVNLIFSYELFRNFKINTHLNILSQQTSLYSIPDSAGKIISEDIIIPFHLIWNSSLSYHWNDCDLKFRVKNLLNNKYEQGGTSIAPIRQLGLWYDFSIAYKF